MLVGFLKKHTRILLFGIILGIGSFFFVPKLVKTLPKSIKVEKIAIIGRPTLSQIPLFIQKQISLGLTDIGPSGEAFPSLASSYHLENDGKRYVFQLKKDLIWHDGKPFTSEDINYNFSDVKIEIISPYEIAFELKEPFSPFLTVVSQPIFRQKKIGLFKKNTTLLGLGKSKVTNIVRNGNFIKQISLESQESKTIYRFFNTQETAILSFKLGEIDKILELSSPGQLANWPNVSLQEVEHKNRYVALFYNTQDNLLSSKKLRQALTYSLSIKSTDQKRAISPLNPNSWAFNPQVKNYDFDPSLSQKLINEEKQENDSLKLDIELTTTLPHLEMAEKIKQDWSKLGINTSIKVSSYLPDTFQVLLIAQEIPPDPDQYSLWHSTQNTNLTKYNSPKVDKLLEDGRQTQNKQERILIYHDFQRFLVEDTPAAFLIHHTTFTITRS